MNLLIMAIKLGICDNMYYYADQIKGTGNLELEKMYTVENYKGIENHICTVLK